MKDANADTRTPEPSDKTEVAHVESAKKQGKKKATADATNDEVRICFHAFRQTFSNAYTQQNGTTPNAASKQPKPIDPEKAAKVTT